MLTVLPLRRGIIAALFFLSLLLSTTSATAPHAAAAAYGRDSFGACDYQKVCPAIPVTESTLPSGLKIAVNLANGQTIPKSGYTIVVTPLNGAGSSFQKADFYIDGVLIQTSTPDDTGTARWFWDPAELPGTTIKVVVTGTDGSTVTQEFTVSIGADNSAVGASAAAEPPVPKGVIATATQAVSHALQQAYDSAKQAVRALPKPVAYGFPYALLALLAGNVLVLLLQAKRELSEYRTLQTLLARERGLTESKKMLISLIAHYLRTPLTVVLSGIDLLEAEGSQAASGLRQAGQQLHRRIEALLSQAPLLQSASTSPSGSGQATPSAWRQPGLFLPLVLTVALAVPFNYVARNAGTLTIGGVNLGVQLILFVLLALVSYQMFRRLQLHRRDGAQLRRLDTAERTTNRARDSFVAGIAGSLRPDVAQLDRLTTGLPASRAGGFILSGTARLHDVLTKLAIAGQLQGARSSEPTQQLPLNDLLDGIMKTLGTAAARQGVTVQTKTGAGPLPVRNPALLSFVLQSVLDNALAYSAEGGAVRVSNSTNAGTARIVIEDQGSGIPAAKLPLLFQPFSKAEGAEVFTHEGMGFSLYLDKLIMNYLGGGIALQSKAGQGTTVTLTLPSAGA
jgi:signal transduction histidine kinase